MSRFCISPGASHSVDAGGTSLCYGDEFDDGDGCKDDRAAKYWDKSTQILGQVQRDANLKSSDSCNENANQSRFLKFSRNFTFGKDRTALWKGILCVFVYFTC